MKRILMALCALLAVGTTALAGEVPTLGDEKSLYDLLDLDRPELKAVKKAVSKGNFEAADKELLKYYRTRKPVALFGLDLQKIKVSKLEQRQADEALEHKFYAHKGYQPSFFYGDDINWRYWPVKDNELRWQLHRHYWFIPLAKCYYVTHDNRYIDAWIDQYTDWVKKNPLDGVERLRAAGASEEEIAAERENVRFAWRPMEAGRRLQDLLTEFALTIQSPRFTPRFLNLFLRTYRQHADHILNNYSMDNIYNSTHEAIKIMDTLSSEYGVTISIERRRIYRPTVDYGHLAYPEVTYTVYSISDTERDALLTNLAGNPSELGVAVSLLNKLDAAYTSYTDEVSSLRSHSLTIAYFDACDICEAAYILQHEAYIEVEILSDMVLSGLITDIQAEIRELKDSIDSWRVAIAQLTQIEDAEDAKRQIEDSIAQLNELIAAQEQIVALAKADLDAALAQE